MFDCNRFFHLVREWKDDDNKAFYNIPILKEVMNHYFDSLAGTADSSKLIIHGGSRHLYSDISYVLHAVGYNYFSVEYVNSDAIVTLRNSL